MGTHGTPGGLFLLRKNLANVAASHNERGRFAVWSNSVYIKSQRRALGENFQTVTIENGDIAWRNFVRADAPAAAVCNQEQSTMTVGSVASLVNADLSQPFPNDC